MKKNVYKLIDESKKMKSEEIASLKDKLTAAERKSKQIKVDLDQALKSNDADRYSEVKSAQRKNEDDTEFYKLKLAEAESTGIIKDPEEVEKLAGELRDEAKNTNAEKLKRAAELLREAEKIVEEARQEVIKCNDALTDLTNKTNVAPGHVDLIMLNGLSVIINNALKNGSINSLK